MDDEKTSAAAVMALTYAVVELTDELHLIRLELQDATKREGGLTAALRSLRKEQRSAGRGKRP